MKEKSIIVSLVVNCCGKFNRILFPEQFVNMHSLGEMQFADVVWNEKGGCLKITFYLTDDTGGPPMLMPRRVNKLGREGKMQIISIGEILNEAGIATRTGSPTKLIWEKCEGENNSFLIFFPSRLRLASLVKAIFDRAVARMTVSDREKDFPVLPSLESLVIELCKGFPGVSVENIKEALNFAAERLAQPDKQD